MNVPEKMSGARTNVFLIHCRGRSSRMNAAVRPGWTITARAMPRTGVCLPSPVPGSPPGGRGTVTSGAAMAALPAAALEQHDRQRLQHDTHVLDESLAAQVLEVIAHLEPHIIDGRVVRGADLREAGDAGLRPLAERVVRDVFLEAYDDTRALGPRPDDVHVAFEHVPELRQLVDAGFTQEPPDRGHPRVVLGGPHLAAVPFGVDIH